MSDEQKFDAIRAALPSLAAGMQLNTGSVGPLPAEVSAVMTELAEYERTIGRSLALDRAITPGTRLVSISHVLWSTGAVLPIRRIVELAHDRGALVAVDGAQAAGAIPFTVTDLGADAYALPAQKWLLGPEGMGALWVSPAAVDRLRPSFAGHFGLETYDSRGAAAWFADARRFESSDYHRPSIAGFARALSWLSMYVGLDYVWSRGPSMARRAADALASVEGVELLTPRHQMATLVTFRIRNWDAEAALDELATRTSAIARTVTSLDALRISVGFFTSEAEIERFVDGVRLLADHDPGSLPPRRTLPIFRPS